MADGQGAATKTKTRAQRRRDEAAENPRASLGRDGPVTSEDEAIAEALEELRHQRDCPAKGQDPRDEGSRVEVIRHKVSAAGLDPDRGGDNDGVATLVVRCCECGAQYPTD